MTESTNPLIRWWQRWRGQSDDTARVLCKMMEQAPTLILNIDQQGKILLASRHHPSFAGHSVFEFVGEQDHEHIKDIIRHVFETGERALLELPILEDDGSFTWNAIRVGPIKLGGKITSLAVVLTNIHPQKEYQRELNWRAEQLATIIQIGHAVSTLTDLPSVLEIIYQQVQRIAPVDVFFVSLLNEDQNSVYFPLTYDLGERYEEKNMELSPNSFVAQTIREKQPICVHFKPEEVEEAARKHPHVGNRQERAKSILFVPLWQAGAVIGALSVQSYEYNAYTQGMIDAVQAVGDQAAIAIHNARLYSHVQKELVERKEIERKLRNSEALYRRAIDAAGAVPYYRDFSSNNYTFMGEGIFQITGYHASEMTPELWDSLELEGIPRGELAGMSYEEADRLTDETNEYAWECDVLIRTRDGETRWVSDTSVVGLDANGEPTGVIGILQDVTERKLHEKQIEDINAALEQRVQERTAELEMANRELESFSYSVSHDLRAPLRAIVGFTRIIKEDYENVLDEQGKMLLGRVIEAGHKMNQLIESLLNFSRLSRNQLHKQDVDMRAIVDSLIEIHSPEADGRQIEWVLGDLPHAQADPTLIRQVLANLVSNAIKYTSKKEIARIEVGFKQEGKKTTYFVSDNGIGFDMQYAEKLFGVFQRLHSEEEFEGVGIGLATVQRIVHRHGGKIWTEAQPGQGATFFFTLGT